jgi:hypothetical protein
MSHFGRCEFTVDQVRDLARATRQLEEIAFNATTFIVSFESLTTHARIDVYYTAGTIGVTPGPTSWGGAGQQVFRRDCDLVEMLKVFLDPEVKLGKEYTLAAECPSRRRRRRRRPRRRARRAGRRTLSTNDRPEAAAAAASTSEKYRSRSGDYHSGSDTYAGAGAAAPDYASETSETSDRAQLLRGVRCAVDFVDPEKEEYFLANFYGDCGEIAICGGYVICDDYDEPIYYKVPKDLYDEFYRQPSSTMGAQSVALGHNRRWWVQWQDGTDRASHGSREFADACCSAGGRLQVALGRHWESWAVIGDRCYQLGRDCPWQLGACLDRELRERGQPTQIRLGPDEEWFAMWSDGWFEYGNLRASSRLPDRIRELQDAGATVRTILFGEDGDWLVRYNNYDDA